MIMDPQAPGGRIGSTPVLPEHPIHNYGFYAIEVVRLLRGLFDDELAQSGLGLTPGEARTLSFAYSFPGERQNALAERMGVNPMTVVGHLDSLASKSLIVRQADPSDRRANVVIVTEAGVPVVLEIAAMYGALRQEAVRDFTSDEVETLNQLLLRLRDGFSAMEVERSVSADESDT